VSVTADSFQIRPVPNAESVPTWSWYADARSDERHVTFRLSATSAAPLSGAERTGAGGAESMMMLLVSLSA